MLQLLTQGHLEKRVLGSWGHAYPGGETRRKWLPPGASQATTATSAPPPSSS